MKHSDRRFSLTAWISQKLNPAALRLLFSSSVTAQDVAEAVQWEQEHAD